MIFQSKEERLKNLEQKQSELQEQLREAEWEAKGRQQQKLKDALAAAEIETLRARAGRIQQQAFEKAKNELTVYELMMKKAAARVLDLKHEIDLVDCEIAQIKDSIRNKIKSADPSFAETESMRKELHKLEPKVNEIQKELNKALDAYESVRQLGADAYGASVGKKAHASAAYNEKMAELSEAANKLRSQRANIETAISKLKNQLFEREAIEIEKLASVR